MTEPPTSLVVDDTATKRYIIGSWLRRAGHRVVEASSAAETWTALAEHEIDLVVLDVRLPDMSGVEVCERIKAAPETASLPVIHISALAVDTADRTRGLRRGADAYIADPIDPEEFLAIVEAILRYYRARRHAERMAGRLATLTRATLEINSADTFERLAEAAAEGAVGIFRSPAAAYVVGTDTRMRRMVCLEPGTRSLHQSFPPDALERLTRLVPGAAAGSTVELVPGRRWHDALPDTALRGEVALVLSRSKANRPPIFLAVQVEAPMGEEELNLLRQFGQTVALAIESLRSYAEEHLIALTLQRSLLPTRLPAVPGWSYAVRYEPAGPQAEVGGDFYELIDLDGRLLVAIGDVQGHSLQAATVMAELRHALRAFADEGHDPVTILQRLNSVMLRYHDDQTATVCLMLLDPGTGHAEIYSAGHLPLLLHGGPDSGYARGGGALLGFPIGGVGVESVTIPHGGAVVLFTDGLVEDPAVPLDENLDRLRLLPAMRDEYDVEALADGILREFVRREDDVALIVLRRT